MSLSTATASRVYSPGDVIIECQPLVYALHTNFKSLLCDCCFRLAPPTGLKTCARCNRVWYCDRDCQIADWPLHKAECKAFIQHPDSHFDAGNTFLPFLLRSLLLFQSQPKLPSEKKRLFTGEMVSFDDLPSRFDFIMYGSDRDTIQFAINSLEKHFGVVSGGLDELRWCCQLKINSYSVLARTGQRPDFPGLHMPVASAVAPEVTVFGHSCAPNAFQVFAGNRIRLVAAKRIEVGEELTLCFTAPCAPTGDRQTRMEETYNLVCECRRCLDRDNLDANGKPINYTRVNMFRDMSFSHPQLKIIRDELGSDSQALAMINKIYPNHHPEKTAFLVKFVKADVALIGKFSVLIVREAIEAMKVTHLNEEVAEFDVKKNSPAEMAEFIVGFKQLK